MSTMMNVPQLRFSEFSGEWEEKKLKEYVLEHKGGAPLKPKDFVSISKFEVIPKKAIQAGGKLLLDEENPTFCTESFFKNNEKNIIDSSYLVTTLRDLVPSGPSIGYIVKNNSKQSLLLAQGVYGFKINDNLNADFLLQLSNRIKYRRLMQRIMVGSTQVHIRNQDFFGILLKLPSKPEQEKIASFLSSVDTKIEQLASKAELLQEYKKGVMQKIFSQEIRFRDDDGSEYPEWVEKKLGDVSVDSYQGINTAADKVNYQKNGYPILQAKHITEEFIDFFDVKYLNEDDYNSYKLKYRPHKNNILISNIGTLGKVVLVENDVDFLVAWNIFKISFHLELVNSKYMLYILRKISSDGYFERMKTGNATKFVNKTDMLNMKLPIPSIEEQAKIVNFLSSIDSKTEQAQKQLDSTKEFKKALLQQMFV